MISNTMGLVFTYTPWSAVTIRSGANSHASADP